VRAAVESSRPDLVEIEVTDQGVGIPAEDIPRIFDRFYQVDNSATRRYGGTGMGLALVRRLVQAHGARVDVTSSVGKGTCVSLRWPVSAAPAEDSAETAPAEPAPNGRARHGAKRVTPVS
jgi:signal transduction histidine kinase